LRRSILVVNKVDSSVLINSPLCNTATDDMNTESKEDQSIKGRSKHQRQIKASKEDQSIKGKSKHQRQIIKEIKR